MAGTANPATPSPLTLNYDGVLEVILANGTHITTSSAPGVVIPPGRYEALINNEVPDTRDTAHIFRLSGPGVIVSTDLLSGDEKSELYTITLAPNAVYTFDDERQPSLPPVVFSTSSAAPAASGTTPVGTAATPSNTTSNSSIAGSEIIPFRGTLNAVVTAAGLTLTQKNRSVTAMVIKAGRYRIVVSDHSARRSLLLRRARKAPLTLTHAAFTGRRAVMITLVAGQWVFYSAGGPKRHFLVGT
jgi:hypothetical protein